MSLREHEPKIRPLDEIIIHLNFQEFSLPRKSFFQIPFSFPEPPSWPQQAIMTKFPLTTLSLLATSAFGVYSILLLTERNGWGPMLRAALEGEPTLPDTGERLRAHYTGLAALDAVLTILVRFFYSCAVGESPALSFFTVYFAGQILPWHAMLVLEGLRKGNKGTALSL